MRAIVELVIRNDEIADGAKADLEAFMQRLQAALDKEFPYARMGSLSVRNVRFESVTPETDLIGPLG